MKWELKQWFGKSFWTKKPIKHGYPFRICYEENERIIVFNREESYWRIRNLIDDLGFYKLLKINPNSIKMLLFSSESFRECKQILNSIRR